MSESDLAVSMTKSAIDHVHRYMHQRGQGEGIRLGVRTTGCSGMAYVLEFVDQVADTDRVFESAGVKVVVDPRSLIYLQGTELDYVKEGLNEGFKFNNPNVKSECGCGESFNV
jgi:iron-sulfur cluster assembly protein